MNGWIDEGVGSSGEHGLPPFLVALDGRALADADPIDVVVDDGRPGFKAGQRVGDRIESVAPVDKALTSSRYEVAPATGLQWISTGD